MYILKDFKNIACCFYGNKLLGCIIESENFKELRDLFIEPILEDLVNLSLNK